MRWLCCLIALCLCLSLPAHAARWQVDPAKSVIEFSGVHAGQAFKGLFKNWQAAIVFEPALLAQSHAEMTIDLSSASTGNPLYDKTLPEADWFDVTTNKTASFTTTGITAQGVDAYSVAGTLTIRGKTVDMLFPATITLQGEQAHLTANAVVDRHSFLIGEHSDPKNEWVAALIGIALDIRATRIPESGAQP